MLWAPLNFFVLSSSEWKTKCICDMNELVSLHADIFKFSLLNRRVNIVQAFNSCTVTRSVMSHARLCEEGKLTVSACALTWLEDEAAVDSSVGGVSFISFSQLCLPVSRGRFDSRFVIADRNRWALYCQGPCLYGNVNWVSPADRTVDPTVPAASSGWQQPCSRGWEAQGRRSLTVGWMFCQVKFRKCKSSRRKKTFLSLWMARVVDICLGLSLKIIKKGSFILQTRRQFHQSFQS